MTVAAAATAVELLRSDSITAGTCACAGREGLAEADPEIVEAEAAAAASAVLAVVAVVVAAEPGRLRSREGASTPGLAEPRRRRASLSGCMVPRRVDLENNRRQERARETWVSVR